MSAENARRRVLQAAAGAGALTALPALAQTQPFSWRRYSGQSIEAHLIKSPRGELLQRNAGEFEALTGIKVGIDLVPEQQSRQKVTIEFNSKKPSFDVVQFGYHVQKRLFSRGKWLEDLRPYMAEAASEFDRADLLPSALATAVDVDGRWDGMPLNLDPFMLYMNKKLFAAKGVAVPKTMVELREAARKLHDPSAGVVGLVGRGLKNANVPLWAIFFLGAGGQYLNGGKLATDTAEAVSSATFYRDLLKAYGPAGISGFNWNEAQSLFLQGRAAMWIDSSGFSAPLEDPTKSRVVGNVGYSAMPAGAKKRLTVTFSDGIGVSSFSPKKGPAWYFVLWATSKNMQARLLSGGGGAPIRASGSANKTELAKINPEYLAALAESLRIAVPGLPIIEPVTEFRDTFGIALVNMLNGADPAAELKRATAEFQPVLDRSEGRA
ncbi:MAG: sugar ABC transporter substrate-binding protein [Burkholderiaceae bacterium]